MGVPYQIAVEPQDYDDYAAEVESKLLLLPFSNHGDGPAEQETGSGNTLSHRVPTVTGF